MSTRDSSVLQPVHNLKLFKRVEGIAQIERFFRAAAELDVDKDDIISNEVGRPTPFLVGVFAFRRILPR